MSHRELVKTDTGNELEMNYPCPARTVGETVFIRGHNYTILSINDDNATRVTTVKLAE